MLAPPSDSGHPPRALWPLHVAIIAVVAVAAVGLWWAQRTETQTASSATTDSFSSPATLTSAPTTVIDSSAGDMPEPTLAPATSSTADVPPIDPLNLTYALSCGRVPSVNVVGGVWSDNSDPLDPLSVSVATVRALADGRQLISFVCLVGPTGRGGFTGLVLLDQGGQVRDVETFPLGTEFSATSDVGATAVVPVYSAEDPACCPSGTQVRELTIGVELELIPVVSGCISGSADLLAWGERNYPADEVRLLQQALLESGFSPGEIDGYWGPNSDAAFAAWIQLQPDWPTIYDIDFHILHPKGLRRLGIAC